MAINGCNGIIEKGLTVSRSFLNGLRLVALDEELLKLLEKTGTYSLGLGIELAAERTLKTTKKVALSSLFCKFSQRHNCQHQFITVSDGSFRG